MLKLSGLRGGGGGDDAEVIWLVKIIISCLADLKRLVWLVKITFGLSSKQKEVILTRRMASNSTGEQIMQL